MCAKKPIYTIGTLMLVATAALVIILWATFAKYPKQPRRLGELTEGQFAAEMVDAMKKQKKLPTTSMQKDPVELLRAMGIAPLDGWHGDRKLNRENYIVLLIMAGGHGDRIRKGAQDHCDRNIDVINSRWQLQHDLQEKWYSLEELLNDKAYFPQGPPKCPYGDEYSDEDGDHKVEYHKHFSGVMEARGR